MKNVLQNILPNYLDYRDCLNLSLINKDYNQKFKKKVEILRIFTPEIIDMIGQKTLLQSSFLPWDNKYLGSTGYLDRVKINHLPDNNNIFYGLDLYKRSFIFAKLKVTEDEKITNVVLVIFRRYTEGSLYVAIDPSDKIYSFFEAQVAINDELRKKLKNIFRGPYKSDKYIIEFIINQ